jgi:hypothetical protein
MAASSSGVWLPSAITVRFMMWPSLTIDAVIARVTWSVAASAVKLLSIVTVSNGS